MNKQLIVHDLEGYILQIQSGQPTPRIPVGVPSLLVEIPTGKYAVRVDVSKEVHEVVFEDLPPSEIQLLEEKFQIELAQTSTELFEMMMAMQGGLE